MDLHIRVPVLPGLLSDVLITACEGGINYWLGSIKTESVKKDGDTFLNAITVRADDEREEHHVSHIEMTNAIQMILDGEVKIRQDLRDSIYAAVTENDAGHIDADGADCIVQVAAFGEVVYG